MVEAQFDQLFLFAGLLTAAEQASFSFLTSDHEKRRFKNEETGVQGFIDYRLVVSYQLSTNTAQLDLETVVLAALVRFWRKVMHYTRIRLIITD